MCAGECGERDVVVVRDPRVPSSSDLRMGVVGARALSYRDAGGVGDGEVGIERVPLVHGLRTTLNLLADLRRGERHLRHVDNRPLA